MKKNLLFCLVLLFAFDSYGQQDERKIIEQIDSLNSLAIEYFQSNNLMESINAVENVLSLSDSINDNYGIVAANSTLGDIYSALEEYEDAERCYLRMLSAAVELDDNYLVAKSYLNLGETYRKSNKGKEVIPYFKQALDFAQKKDARHLTSDENKEKIIFMVNMNLCSVYLKSNKPNEALIYLLRAEENLNNSSFDDYNEGYFSYMYGLYLLQKGSFYKANDKFEEAMVFLAEGDVADDTAGLQLLAEVYRAYSESEATLGNNEQAYELLLDFNDTRAQLINEEVVKQEKIAKAKLDILEYQRIAELANKERLLQEDVTRNMQRINLIITFAICLLIASFITLYKNYSSKRKLSLMLEARNRQLEIAKNEAEKSSRLKTNFISNVTHELRTPLYGVVGLSSILLKNNDLSERDNKFLKSLKFSGDYLLNLINDILQVGKMEQEDVELQNNSVSLKLLLNNIIDSFEYRLQENNNQIQLSIDDNIPSRVMCDNVRLSQVLINLIGNSIKFTENGKIWVSVQATDFTDNGVGLRFAVRDNGPGIPKDKHKKIFDNFSQLNDKNTSNYQGTGLGLSIAKNLVELFGGTIGLESELGKGSEFSFEVVFEIDQTSILSDDRTAQDDNKILPIHEKYTILVAEDNKINQIVTQNVLEKGNFECEVVENGLDALNAVKEKHYDLVLMDLNMPVMNGTDATKEIRKINDDLPIIALTAADIEEVKNDFEAIGFNDVITKPFDNFVFYQKITSNIQKSKLSISYNAKLEKVS